MRRRLGTGIAVVAAFALLGLGASVLLVQSVPATPDLAVQQHLMCPQCQGVRLDVCDRPVCLDMRADIRRRLAAGEGQAAILADYEGTYGPAVLATAGSSTAAGLVPWLFVGLGLLLLIGLAAVRRAVRPPGEREVGSDGGLVDRELAAWRSGR